MNTSIESFVLNDDLTTSLCPFLARLCFFIRILFLNNSEALVAFVEDNLGI
jgi:hypothetical protein